MSFFKITQLRAQLDEAQNEMFSLQARVQVAEDILKLADALAEDLNWAFDWLETCAGVGLSKRDLDEAKGRLAAYRSSRRAVR